jgi:hypothetical protein
VCELVEATVAVDLADEAISEAEHAEVDAKVDLALPAAVRCRSARHCDCRQHAVGG